MPAGGSPELQRAFEVIRGQAVADRSLGGPPVSLWQKFGSVVKEGRPGKVREGRFGFIVRGNAKGLSPAAPFTVPQN